MVSIMLAEKENNMLTFFDEHYFSEKCSCDTSNDDLENNCEYHARTGVENTVSIKNSSSKSTTNDVQIVNISQSFPRQPVENYLTNMIEYRVKILLVQDKVFTPGESGPVLTNINVKRKPGKLSLMILAPENTSLRFLSEGIISPNFRGQLSVHLQNPTCNQTQLNVGAIVGYLILKPFLNESSV